MVNSNSCTAAFTQLAGIAALTGPQDGVKTMVDAFRKRRDVIVAGLNQIPGFRCANPGGAFYVFPNIEGVGMASKPLADYLLDKAGVALLSGDGFGLYGQGYIRFSYANSVENIEKALAQIKEAVAALEAV
jgi:aspartate/methionine/tyrosine aminotransferase